MQFLSRLHSLQRITLAVTAVGAAVVAVCAGLDHVATFAVLQAMFTHDTASGLLLAEGVVALDPAKVEAALKSIGDDVKEVATKFMKQREQDGEVSAKLVKTADELLLKQGELQARLSEVEKKQAEQKDSEKESRQYKSLGEQFVSNEEVAAVLKSGSGRAKCQVKEITSLPASGGAGVAPDRRPGVILPPEQKLSMRDLIAPGRTSSSVVEYVKENVFTNNAGPVSEGVLKPESNITYAEANAIVRTLAHWILATKQIYADFDGLASMINARLRYGLKLKEDAQLLMGSGSGQNLYGIFPQATAYALPSGLAMPSPETKIDRLRAMLLQAELAGYPADGIVLNPTDWTSIELTKTTDGAYLFSNPTGTISNVLWGRRVVDTVAMTVDNALVGAFRMGAQIFDREDFTILVSDEDRDNFVKNKVTILGEERLTLATYVPAAFVKDTNLPAV